MLKQEVIKKSLKAIPIVGAGSIRESIELKNEEGG